MAQEREPPAELARGAPPLWRWADPDVQANNISRQQKATVRKGGAMGPAREQQNRICCGITVRRRLRVEGNEKQPR